MAHKTAIPAEITAAADDHPPGILVEENASHQKDLRVKIERRTTELNRRTEELEQANLRLHQEIASRQEIENKLKEANDRWQTTFDSMPDFISIHAPDYTILKANKALAQFLGQRPEDIIGKKCHQIFHGSHNPWSTCPHRELLATGQSHTCEVIDPHLGKPLLITVSPLTNEGQIIGSIHVAKDISRQKKMEAERQKNINLESIAVLCGGLAHDFNNLLTALNGYIDLAKMEKNSERMGHWLNNAKMVASLATELTRQLLTFSKGGAPIINCVPVAALIQDSLDQAQNSFPNVQPVVRIAQDTWPIDGDHAHLRTVVQNIFYNAGEAMPGGGALTIEAKNLSKGTIPPLGHSPFESSPEGDSVHSPLTADSVLISFTDHGIGISPEILGKIFDPYFTTSAKGAIKGKGLGLALCHSIISKHHGQISVSSKKGRGTTVSICLPASPAAANDQKSPAEKTVQPTLPQPSPPTP